MAVACVSLLFAASPAMAGTVETASAAGSVTVVAGGVGGPGPGTRVALDACGVTVAGDALYVGNHVDVRRVSTATGSLTTVAGNGSLNAGRNGASAAQFAFAGAACGTAVDKFGNLLVAGPGLEVMAARTGVFYGQSMTVGHVYTIMGRKGDAVLKNPVGVALDHAGNIVVSDSGSPACGDDCAPQGGQVLVVASKAGTFYTRKMTAGGVYVVAGGFGPNVGAVRLDRAGNLLVPDGGEQDAGGSIAPSVRVVAVKTGVFYGQKMTAGHVYRVAGNGHLGGGGDGGPARKASLNLAGGVVADSTGNLVIADGRRARVVAVRTGRYYGRQMSAGDIYSIAGAGRGGYSGDGGPAAKAVIYATTVALDSSGNVVLGCGYRCYRVRVVAAKSGTFYGRRMAARDIYTVAGTGFLDSGDGGPAVKADFSAVLGTAEDPSGDLAFADGGSRVWVVMARSGTVYGRTLAAGDSYTIGGNGSIGYAGDGGPAAKAAFSFSQGAIVTFDRAGNVVVADTGNDRVRVIAASTGTFYGRKMTSGDVYTIAGTGSCGFSGDGGPATKARVCSPVAVSTDHAGNLLVTDGSRVRVVAASTGMFYGREMRAGDIYTIAGDGNSQFTGNGVPATTAGMWPSDAVADPEGNVIVTDAHGNQRVRLVAASTGMFYGREMTAGDIYTIAGDGTDGISGSGGPAVDAELEQPCAAAVDNSGNVVFSDHAANVVWVVAARTGMFYGLPMTAGDIYIVAGNGRNLGNDGLGDGGPAPGSTLDEPDGVAISPAGALLVGDELNNRVRAIAS
jgi:hypothetical protein